MFQLWFLQVLSKIRNHLRLLFYYYSSTSCDYSVIVVVIVVIIVVVIVIVVVVVIVVDVIAAAVVVVVNFSRLKNYQSAPQSGYKAWCLFHIVKAPPSNSL